MPHRLRFPALFNNLLFVSAFLMLTYGSFAHAQPAAEASALSPQENTTAFYKWYLHAMAQNKVPFRDDRKNLLKYVAAALIKEVDKKYHSADGLDADYFIQAQDYLDDWESNIAISKVEIKGKTASMLVTLGATAESKYRLAVNLVKEGDAWKIRKVKPV